MEELKLRDSKKAGTLTFSEPKATREVGLKSTSSYSEVLSAGRIGRWTER